MLLGEIFPSRIRARALGIAAAAQWIANFIISETFPPLSNWSLPGTYAIYAIFAALLLLSAVIVILPGSPLGLLTEGVQTLAGVLLPSATVFLLLLCNDRGVLGPWTNSRGMNVFSGVIIAVLVMLSTILTASVLFPDITSGQIIAIFAVGGALALIAGGYLVWAGRRRKGTAPVLVEPELDRATWRMPPIALMSKPVMSAGSRTGLTVLRGYLLVASALVVVKVIQLAMGS